MIERRYNRVYTTLWKQVLFDMEVVDGEVDVAKSDFANSSGHDIFELFKFSGSYND